MGISHAVRVQLSPCEGKYTTRRYLDGAATVATRLSRSNLFVFLYTLKDLIVFGVSFNQGSFQAIPSGGGTLRSFTVPAAPTGDLNAPEAFDVMLHVDTTTRARPNPGR